MLWLNSVVGAVRVKHEIMFKGGKSQCFVDRYKFVAPCSTVNSVNIHSTLHEMRF